MTGRHRALPPEPRVVATRRERGDWGEAIALATIILLALIGVGGTIWYLQGGRL